MEPTLEQIRTIAKEGDYRRIPVKKELFADHITPTEALRALRGASYHCFLLESAEANGARGRYTFLGFEPTLEFTCSAGKARIRTNLGTDKEACQTRTLDHPNNAIRRIIKDYKSPQLPDFPPFAGGLVGYFSFDYFAYSEPSLRKEQPAEKQLGEEDFLDVDLMAFDSVIVFDSYRQKVVLITGVYPCANQDSSAGRLDAQGVSSDPDTLDNPDAQSAAHNPDALGSLTTLEQSYKQAEEKLAYIENILLRGPRHTFETLHLEHDFIPSLDESHYCAMIEKAKDHIHEGDIFQVVLSNPLTAPGTGSLFDAYRVLRSENPSPYMLYFTSDSVEIAGASPETLVRLEGDQLQTFPLAGTRPRGATSEEDKRIKEELLADEKELAEHNMLVDLGRNDLGRVCSFGSVHVDTYLDVLEFSRVMHIGSTVKGTINPDKDALDAVDAVLPAGTLSGAPKIRACEIINELEPTPRGIYGGALGYLDFSGNMDICIAIRLAYKKHNQICVQSGAGIVADSDPASEYRECQNKAAAVITALTTANGGL
ncbi:MAG: anthranilate synthase component I family protein [Eggerthellaceae bacterium]|nr:anthranilate synthase component I family protein [Eggerthellaceae bacterium]